MCSKLYNLQSVLNFKIRLHNLKIYFRWYNPKYISEFIDLRVCL